MDGERELLTFNFFMDPYYNFNVKLTLSCLSLVYDQNLLRSLFWRVDQNPSNSCFDLIGSPNAI